MICIECRREADSVKNGVCTHEWFKAANSGRTPKVGHKGCTGCDCRHRPVELRK